MCSATMRSAYSFPVSKNLTSQWYDLVQSWNQTYGGCWKVVNFYIEHLFV